MNKLLLELNDYQKQTLLILRENGFLGLEYEMGDEVSCPGWSEAEGMILYPSDRVYKIHLQ